MDFGKYLLPALHTKKMTQKILAEKLNTSTAYINDLCKNRKSPSLSMLDKICDVLEMTPIELFSSNTEKPYMELSESEIALVNDYRDLYDYEKEVIYEMVRSLRQKHASCVPSQSRISASTHSLSDASLHTSSLPAPTDKKTTEIPSNRNK